MANFAAALSVFQKLFYAEIFQFFPRIRGNAVQEVVVYMIGPKVFKLPVEDFFHVIAALNRPVGKFRGDIDLFPQSAGKSTSEKGLACAEMVGYCRVKIVDSLFDCKVNLADCLFLVDKSGFLRQSHAAETYCRELFAVGTLSVKHTHGLFYYLKYPRVCVS